MVELVREKTQINIKLDKMDESVLSTFKEIDGVFDAKIDKDMIALFVSNAENLLAEIISKASENKWVIQSVDVKKPNLETVFLHLTGKALRD